MAPEQRKLAFDLIIRPPNGQREISPEQFAGRFPAALHGGKVALTLLEDATREQSSDDLQAALIVGFAFGFSSEHTLGLCELLDAEWHVSHEDIISALQDLRDPRAIEALYRATSVAHAYLAYDAFHGLARICTWAFADIGTSEALTKLQLLAASDNSVVVEYARKRIDNWEAEKRRKST